MPVYRHPSDQSLPLLHFSPTVQLIREHVQRIVQHPVNHVLIQLYRSGQDYISEHSDKTLDIVHGSSIVNVSFGAQRTMRLRMKKSTFISDDLDDDSSTASASASATSPLPTTTTRQTQRIPMPHNSLFILGPRTNTRWLHGINPDKRLPTDRLPLELTHGGSRISLTFRHIGTFLNAEGSRIWGQGATAKRKEQARRTVNGDEKRTEAMVRAFSAENRESGEGWDWKSTYGVGFDVLHFKSTESGDGELPMLFLGCDPVGNKQVASVLEELGLRSRVMDVAPALSRSHSHRRPGPDDAVLAKEVPLGFRDTDTLHTEISGVLPTLFYLDRFYALDTTSRGQCAAAAAYEILFLIEDARRLLLDLGERVEDPENLAKLKGLFGPLEQRLERSEFVAGDVFSVADCALWPVVERVFAGEEEGRVWEGFAGMEGWWARMRERESVRGVRERFGGGDEEGK